MHVRSRPKADLRPNANSLNKSAAAAPGSRSAPHGDRPAVDYDFRLGFHAALRASGRRAPKCLTRSVSPCVRSRMSTASVLMSTRSTSNCTMRTCSAGNSSSRADRAVPRPRTSASLRPFSDCLARRHVRTMASSRARTCSITALSISAAGMGRTPPSTLGPSSPAVGLDEARLGRRWRNLSKGLALRKHVPFVFKPSWAGRLDRCAAPSIDVVDVRLQPNIKVGAAKGGEQIDVQRLRQPDPLQRLPRSI
jgi:hypothetical protein